MKVKMIAYILLLLPFLMGANCKKYSNIKYEIYENHEVSACGINDPLKNIVWIRDYVDAHLKSYSTHIFIYKNKTSETKYFVVETNTKFEPDRSPSSIKTTSVYTCSGERILFSGTEGQIPDTWDDFFLQNEKILILWSVKQIN